VDAVTLNHHLFKAWMMAPYISKRAQGKRIRMDALQVSHMEIPFWMKW
jgi:hypothetical protein